MPAVSNATYSNLQTGDSANGTVAFTGPTDVRVYTLPDATETIATLGQTQTLTGAKTFSGNVVLSGTLTLGDGTAATETFSTNLSGATDPSIVFGNDLVTLDTPLRLATGDELEWSTDTSLSRIGAGIVGVGNGTAANVSGTIQAAGGWQAANTKALADGVATAFVQIAVAAGSFVGGYVDYTIHADDGTDFQARSGQLHFVAVNKADTETIQLGRADGGTTVDNTTDIVAASAGTLTNTFTSAAGSNAFTILANAASSLTETTLAIKYRVVISSGTATVTPQ